MTKAAPKENVREVWVIEGYFRGWYPTYGGAYTNRGEAFDGMAKLRGKRRIVLYVPKEKTNDH